MPSTTARLQHLKAKQAPAEVFEACAEGGLANGDINHATWLRIFRVVSLVYTSGQNAEIEDPNAYYNYFVHSGEHWGGYTAIEWLLGASMFVVCGLGAYSVYAQIEKKQKLQSVDYLTAKIDKAQGKLPCKTKDVPTERLIETEAQVEQSANHLRQLYLSKGFVSQNKTDEEIQNKIEKNYSFSHSLLQLQSQLKSETNKILVLLNKILVLLKKLKEYLSSTTSIYWLVWMTSAYFITIPGVGVASISYYITITSLLLSATYAAVKYYLTPKELPPTLKPEKGVEKKQTSTETEEAELSAQIDTEKNLYTFLDERFSVFTNNMNKILARAPASFKIEIDTISKCEQTIQPTPATGKARSILAYTPDQKSMKFAKNIFGEAWGMFTSIIFMSWLLTSVGCLFFFGIPYFIPLLAVNFTSITSSATFIFISDFLSSQIFNLLFAGLFGVLKGLLTYANQIKEQLTYDLFIDKQLKANCLFVDSTHKCTNEEAFDYLYAQVEEKKRVVETIQAKVLAEYAAKPSATKKTTLDTFILAFNCKTEDVMNEALFVELQDQFSKETEFQNFNSIAYKLANGGQTAFFHVRNVGLADKGGILAGVLNKVGKALFNNGGPMKHFLNVGFFAFILGSWQRLSLYRTQQEHARKKHIINAFGMRIKFLQHTVKKLDYIEKLYDARHLIDSLSIPLARKIPRSTQTATYSFTRTYVNRNSLGSCSATLFKTNACNSHHRRNKRSHLSYAM